MALFTPERYVDEFTAVDDLAAMLSWDNPRRIRVNNQARHLLDRSASMGRKAGEIESFLKQYSLDTNEGVALVCLAEALLRIPDAATANDLIRDKVTAVNWLQSRIETSDWLVKAARFGLSLTKSTLDSFFSKLGAPVIRQGMVQGIRMLGRQFVLGQTIDEALKNAADETAKGYALSFDMLGEGARTFAMADTYFNAYVSAIASLAAARDRGHLSNPRTGISVKLSALHPRYTPYQADLCRPVLAERLLQLCQLAARHDLTLTVDAEETERLTLSLAIFQDVAEHPTLKGWEGLGLAVQAYQKFAPELIDHVGALAATTRHVFRVRLVKGAYWDTEVKRAQTMGLPDYPVWTRKANTDLSYLVCAQKMLQFRNEMYPMFATHNAHTVASILELAGNRNEGYEFQRLQGMGAPLHDVLVRDGLVPVTIYAPVGTHEDLLAYLVRRLLENGANTSFVNKLHKGAMGDDLLTDPVHIALNHATRRHRDLPLPRALFGTRKNSIGVDLAQGAERASVTPLGPLTLPPLADADDKAIDQAFVSARAVFLAWSGANVNVRADALEKFADLMERDMARLMQLARVEAFKTWNDALSEVREAIDFTRYYAAQAREQFDKNGITLPGPTGEDNWLVLTGRGTFVCISPWNFPLAIFVGQVTAALAAGNCVIAKPAEQTPHMAKAVVDLMHEAGIPRDVVQLIIGDGRVGGQLVAHPDVAGVAFTGSTEVARLINRTLAVKDGAIVPLIAETGGQNAMIVDSTALLEQVCDDVMVSAFGSTGQRCSALRVLYVQDDVADKVIGLLAGAMAHLRVGDPADIATDIGPVIDGDALDRLVEHENFLKEIGARLLARALMPEGLSGHYFAPVSYEIKSMRQLPGEVFGPILHVVRFAAGDLPRVVDEINASGYGLTFGVHSRIDDRINDLSSKIHAGNVYINRTMIGAVVGVQPFGGQGLSGTGPKAGGPHYLMRFAHEKTITRNTAASGGNIKLVAGSD